MKPLIFVLAIFVVILNSCGNNVSQQNALKSKRVMSFDSSIHFTEKEMGTFNTPNDLIYFDKFQPIYEHDSLYIDDAIKFLESNQFTNREKRICIYSMQNLRIRDYVTFCTMVVKLFEEQKINEQLLTLLLQPDFQKKFILANNYKNEEVQLLLGRIAANKLISEHLQEEIARTLSGEKLKEVSLLDESKSN